MDGVYILVALILVTGQISKIDASGWNYENEAHWQPDICQQGKRQSPISLSNGISSAIEHPPFVLSGYGESLTAMLKNNGHSAEVRPLEGQAKPQIHGGGLPRIYEFDHFHFHWQSEHVMEGIRFPLELHMVHYAADYRNVSTAIQHPYGVAVVGVFFHLSPDDDEDFEPLIQVIDTLKDRINEPVKMEDVVPKSFLPRDLAGYFRYDGSLTTPGCNEGVVWTVLTQSIPISKNQVQIFETLHTEQNKVLKKNYRSLQALNGRTLYQKVSPLPGEGIGGASTNKISSFTVLAAVLYCLLRY